MTLADGTRLGHYQVKGPLGAGGMGQVYRASDTKLGRDVAIKVLPPEVAGVPDRSARFEREARVLATLNHPNVAAIHGLEDADGKPFLVLELVEGEDLAERLARGPLGVDEAIAVARQLARLTFAAELEQWPAFSPDGRRLVHCAERDGVAQLVLKDPASGEERRLSSGDRDDTQPAWSPDGRYVVFDRVSPQGRDLWLLAGLE